jgi:uncharacterized protein YaiL (DUF2058 family)
MRTNPNIIGRLCVVRDIKGNKALVEAMVIDRVAETDRAKRVRLQTGEHFGEVRMPGEYELIEFVEPGEAPAFIAMAWAPA